MTDMKMIIDYDRNASLSLVENNQGKFAILKKADELEYQNERDENSTIKLFNDTKKVLDFVENKTDVFSTIPPAGYQVVAQ